MRRAAFLLLAATACNALIGLGEPQVKDAPPDPTAFRAYTSGSRLRAEVWDVDGVRALHGWYDAARNEECVFERAGDSGTPHYCLPTDSVEVTWFADAACTQGVDLRFAHDGPPKTYLVVRPDDACSGPPKVYMRGGPLPLATFYTGRPGACFAQQGATPTSVSSVGDLVPLDAFVAGREVVEDRGGRIASLTLVTDDGAREVISGYDAERREASWVVPSGWIGVPTPTWMPAHFAWHYPSSLREFYDDPGCANPIAASYVPKRALCPFTGIFGEPPLRNAGDPVDASGVRTRSDDGGCALVSALGLDFLYVRLGDPVPLETLAPAATVKVGDGRIQIAYDGIDGAGAIAPPINEPDTNEAGNRLSFFDQTTGEACALQPTPDGLTRCLPMATATPVFADAACTQPAMHFDDSRTAPTTAALALDGVHFAARTTGRKLGDDSWVSTGGVCQQGPVGPCYALGDDVTTQFEVVNDLRE